MEWAGIDLESGEDAAEDGFELGDVDGFDEVFGEAGFAAFADIVFHAVAAECDAFDAVEGLEFLHEFVTGGVGQADVADEDIEGFGGGELEGGGGGVCDLDDEAGIGEEACEGARGIEVVFDEEDARGAGGDFGGDEYAGVGVGWGDGFPGILKLEGEGGAFSTAGAGSGEGTAVHFDDGFGDGEAEAEAAELTGNACIALFEGVEDFWEQFGRDTFAAIRDFNEEPIVTGFVPGADGDVSAVGCEFDGVAEEIPEDLLEAGGIAGEIIVGGVEVLADVEAFSAGVGEAVVDGVEEDFVGVDGLHLEAELSAGDAGEIEEVVDEFDFKVDIAADHGEVFAEFLREVGVGFDGGDGHGDGGEGGAEFVAEDGEEFVLGAVGGVGFGAGEAFIFEEGIAFFLGELAVGVVAGGTGDGFDGTVGSDDGGKDVLVIAGGTVGIGVGGFVDDAFAGLDDLLDLLLEFGGEVVGVMEFEEIFSDGLGEGEAPEVEEGFVDVGEAAVEVEGVGEVGDGGEDAVEGTGLFGVAVGEFTAFFLGVLA